MPDGATDQDRWIPIDTDDTIRADGGAPPPDPVYLTHLEELLALRVGHLPIVGRAGEWRLQVQVVVEGQTRCHYAGGLAYPIPAGLYTGLYRGVPSLDTVWMSDCPPEIWSMWDGIAAITQPECKRVLLTGLGLGVILQHALRQPHVARVDVVELDADVITLIRPHYRDRRLHVHRGDALTIDLRPRRLVWDLAYHDFWQGTTAANLLAMYAVTRHFAGRVGRQLCWKEAECVGDLARQAPDLAAAWPGLDGGPFRAPPSRA